jgi:hypothetical protein
MLHSRRISVVDEARRNLFTQTVLLVNLADLQ